MDDLVLSCVEVARLGYALTLRECAERLTVGRLAIVRELVDLPAGDPRRLPSARIPSRRGQAHRVRPQDLEQLIARVSAPTPLPTDAVSTIEAIAVLAGQHVPSRSRGGTTYVLWCNRLRAAVRDGRLTEYQILGMRRYSTAELEVEKMRLAAAGINGRRARRSAQIMRAKAAEAAAKAEGLVTTREVSRITGLKYETVRRWGPKGWYGSRKICGQWFFERAQIEARRNRARPSLPEDALIRTCKGGCGKTLRRTPSQVKRNKGGAYYCGDCWRAAAPRELASRLAAMAESEPTTLFQHRSDAQRRSWVNGSRDRADYEASWTGEPLRKAHKSKKATVKRIDKMMQKRFGHGLTEQRQREIEGRALSRAQRDSTRSKATRKLEQQLRELWATSKTVPQIAEELGTTVSNIKKLRQRLDLPPRTRGRRNSDKTLGTPQVTL